jgi:hypothetical protein
MLTVRAPSPTARSARRTASRSESARRDTSRAAPSPTSAAYEHQPGKQSNGRSEQERDERAERRELNPQAPEPPWMGGDHLGQHRRNDAERRKDLDRVDERAGSIHGPGDRRNGRRRDGREGDPSKHPRHGANR